MHNFILNNDTLYKLFLVTGKMADGCLSLLFPHRCPFCDAVTDFGKRACDSCLKNAPLIQSPYCYKCGKRLTREEQEYCRDCARKRHYFVKGRALFEYRSMENSFYRFKYGRRQEYGVVFGDMLAVHLGEVIKAWEPDILAPVPIHFKRRQKRGYNQAEIVARQLSIKLRIPFEKDLLKRTKNTAPMKNLGDVERQNNLQKAFKVGRNDVKWKTIIIIDDIYTTGATLDMCARTLLAKGARRVYFITVAIGREV